MRNSIYRIVSVIAALSLASCADYLDIVPDNVATIDYAFRNRVSCEKFLYTCYSYRPAIGDLSTDPGIAASSEFWGPNENWGVGCDIAAGRQSVNNTAMNFWNGWNNATPLWVGIRDCNIFLENVDKVIDLTPYEKKRWVAEVQFLKAYYHFFLFRMYGPIPIVDVNLPISASPDETHVYREPVDDVVDYIVNLLDEAAASLPNADDVIEGTEAGRVYDLVAKSMKAKVLLYAASPLFNGNTTYASMVDNRGKQLFPQQYDNTKWEKAAKACLEAIELAEKEGKELYYKIDPYTLGENEVFQLQTTLRQILADRWNCELIWGSTNHNQHWLSSMSQARIMNLASDRRENTPNGLGVTMQTVERFYSSHGVPIEEDLEWNANNWYQDRYSVRPEPSSGEDAYYVQAGERTAYLHYNREPRFYAHVGFDRAVYYGNGKYKYPDLYHAEYRRGEYSSMLSINYGGPVTAYCPKKLHSFKDALTTSAYSTEYFPFPIIRLADLYLMYAEALNEAEGPNDTVYEYIDKVRERAGLEGVVASWEKYSSNPTKPTTKDGLREIIQRERDNELAFEGQYFWDIRRWKKISDLNVQPTGWNIFNGETEEDFYKVVRVSKNKVEFGVKDYFWPINEYEISINPNLVQNYGW